jgi:hypothetical protein
VVENAHLNVVYKQSPTNNNPLDNIPPSTRGAGAMLVPEFGFLIAVAVATPPAEVVFEGVPIPSPAVVVAAAAVATAATGGPLQYSAKIEDSVYIRSSAPLLSQQLLRHLRKRKRVSNSRNIRKSSYRENRGSAYPRLPECKSQKHVGAGIGAGVVPSGQS